MGTLPRIRQWRTQNSTSRCPGNVNSLLIRKRPYCAYVRFSQHQRPQPCKYYQCTRLHSRSPPVTWLSSGMCFVSSLTQLYLCQQHFGRILNIFLDLDKELHGFSAVQKSMVICKGEVHHRSDLNLAIHSHWSVHDRMQPKHSCLR